MLIQNNFLNVQTKLEEAEQLINYLASALEGQHNERFNLTVQLMGRDKAMIKFMKYDMMTCNKWKSRLWKLKAEFPVLLNRRS